MIYIGVDIAKSKHCACVNNPNTGELLVEPFFFSNTKEGFELFLSSIKGYDNALIGLEDTGHYGNNFLTFLLENNLEVALVNPRSTKEFRKIMNWPAKNDKKDTILITHLLTLKNSYRLVSNQSTLTKELKEYTRRYHDKVEDIARYKSRLQKAIDLVFPEYNDIFNTPYTNAYMNVLKHSGSAQDIASTDIRTIRNLIKNEGRGRPVTVSAEHLKESAKNSIGQHNEATVLEIKHLVALIELLEDHVKGYKKKIEDFSHQLESPIISIPGISHISGMTILAELGDINNFDSASKLVSYAGVAPYTIQSGDYEVSKTSITKTGPSYLRKALYQCCLSVTNNIPTFNSYYNKKRTEGKTHLTAQSHTVRKLLRIIYHLLFNNVKFDENQLI